MTTKEFENWVNAYKNRLYRMAYSMLLEKQSAQDLVQEVFITLWLKRDMVHKLKSIEAWCITITKNKCLNAIKKKNTIKNYTAHNRGIPPYKPDDYLQAKELESIINETMLKLTGLQRAILYLRDNEYLDYKTIGEWLEISKSNVKIQMFRARKFISSELKKRYDYE